MSLGPNPYNFVYKIQVLVLGTQPNTGYDKQQAEAIKKLEQLQIRDWKYIKPFLQDFMYYSSVARYYYDKSIGEKLFLKLPAPLGNQIHKQFKESHPNLTPQLDSIGFRINHIIDCLVQRCTEIQISRQLKGENSYCKNIYTPQNYGSTNKEKNRPKKYKKYPNRERYFLRKSNARKPYLNKDKHVRRFNKQRDYKSKLSCYTCGSTNHLARECNKRHNIHNKQSILVNCVNEDLIEVDEYIGDTESIYSIVSIENEMCQDTSSEEEENGITTSMLEFNRKCKESYEEKIGELEGMLENLDYGM